MKSVLFISILLSVLQSGAEISFQGLPPARTAAESIGLRQARRDRVMQTMAGNPLKAPPVAPKIGLDEFAQSMLGRMVMHKDLAAVSENLLRPEFKPWNVGTSIAIAGPLCKRTGDYDFVLQPLIAMAYLDEEANETLLSEPAREKLHNVLLSERGIKHHIEFTLPNCVPVSVTDSENHILMSETARYLTNQLLFADSVKRGQPLAQYDNSKNGFDEWMLNHLAPWLRTDFGELNSRPYQGYTLIGLANLHTFAKSKRVSTAAQMVLDYLSAKTALQSSGLRRHPPFRRQKKHRADELIIDDDDGMFFFTPLVGNYEYLALMPGNETALSYKWNDFVATMASVLRYEVAPPIVDLFVNRDHPDFVRLKHRDVEIYASSKNFLISSGGRFRAQFGFFTGENDEWGVSTTIIPAHYGLNQAELFRFDGPTDWHKHNNICVAPGFACGENFYAPKIDPACTIVKGAWTFYDLDSCASTHMGFYVAAYREPLTNFAAIEVREPTLKFSDFTQSVLAKNPALKLVKGKISTFTTSDSREMKFTPESGNVGTSPLSEIDGQPLDTDSNTWPLATGNVMNSNGDGLITIDNHETHERLILDDRDILHPKRSIERL